MHSHIPLALQQSGPCQSDCYERSHSCVLCAARFIYAFGGVGLFTFLTACIGLLGVGVNSRFLLGVYSTLVALMLVCQAGVAASFFFDNTWIRRLPRDDTGEFELVGDARQRSGIVRTWSFALLTWHDLAA